MRVHPHYIGPRDAQYDVAASISDPDSMWIVWPQLYFSCTLRPLNAAVDQYNNSSEDIPLYLVFFWCLWRPSASHHWHHGKKGSQNWLRKLYEPFPFPTLYVGRVEDVLGRVPLYPCFLDGNLTSTIPHKYAARQARDFEYGCADGPLQGSRRGSHVYEVNTWLWNFGRPQPRVGGLSVAATQKIRKRCKGELEAAKAAWKDTGEQRLRLAGLERFLRNDQNSRPGDFVAECFHWLWSFIGFMGFGGWAKAIRICCDKPCLVIISIFPG